MKIMKNKLFALTVLALSTTLVGCASTSSTKESSVGDADTMLVGQNMDKKIWDASQTINKQLDLLVKLETKSNQTISHPSPIVHNLEMDARGKDVKFLPKPAVPPKPIVLSAKEKFEHRVDIRWYNESVDEVVKRLSTAVNYEFVVSRPADKKAKMINFVATNQAIGDVFAHLGNNIDSFADIAVDHKTQKITLTYK